LIIKPLKLFESVIVDMLQMIFKAL